MIPATFGSPHLSTSATPSDSIPHQTFNGQQSPSFLSSPSFHFSALCASLTFCCRLPHATTLVSLSPWKGLAMIETSPAATFLGPYFFLGGIGCSDLCTSREPHGRVIIKYTSLILIYLSTVIHF